MLREIPNIQPDGELQRRWFKDEYFDLVVWLDQAEAVVMFELSYDRRCDCRVIRWTERSGCMLFSLDEGDPRAGRKPTPILVPTLLKDKAMSQAAVAVIARRFKDASQVMEASIAAMIYQELAECAAPPAPVLEKEPVNIRTPPQW